MAPGLTEFYENPLKYYNGSNRNGASQFAHNHMAFDLGYGTEAEDPQKVDEIAQEVVDNYDLILIRYAFS